MGVIGVLAPAVRVAPAASGLPGTGSLAIKALASAFAAILLSLTAAAAGDEKAYVWRGWMRTATDYMIVHSLPKDGTENDFYLVCHGGREHIDVSIRGIASGGYGEESETDVTTTFVFGKKRVPVTAANRGPAEMLGGISISYVLERNAPVLAAIARGEPFRIELPKVKTQLFSPKDAVRFFREMAAHCKAAR